MRTEYSPRFFSPKSLLPWIFELLSVVCAGGQPYYDNHIQNRYVKENTFLTMAADTATPPGFIDIRGKLSGPQGLM